MGETQKSLVGSRPALIPWRPVEVAGGFVIVLLSAVLRWHNIGDQSLWLDEIGEAVVARSDDLFAGVRTHAAAAPLDYLGVRLVTELFGDTTVAVRGFAFAMSVLAVALTLVAAWLTAGAPRVALVAGALMAISPFQIYYGQEARFYASSTVCATLLIIAFAAAARSGRWTAWALYGLTVGIGLYTHYLVALLVAAQGLSLFAVAVWRSRRLPLRSGLVQVVRVVAPCAIATGFAIALFVPWLVYAGFRQITTNYGFFPAAELGPERLLSILSTLIAPSEPLTVAGSILTVVLVAVGTYGVARWRVWDTPSVVAMVGVIVIAIPAGYLANTLTTYRFAERQIIFLLPAAAILVGAGLVRAYGPGWSDPSSRGRRWATSLLVALMAILVLPSLRTVYDGTWRIKEDWRGAAAVVATEACPTGRILVTIADGYAFGVGWYRPELLDRSDHLKLSGRGLLVDLKALDIRADDVVVVFVPQQGVFAPGVGGIEVARDFLSGRGLKQREMTPRLMVYAAAGPCDAA